MSNSRGINLHHELIKNGMFSVSGKKEKQCRTFTTIGPRTVQMVIAINHEYIIYDM